MARGFSFFWRRGQLSAEIRGRQVAEALGGKQNPTSGYHDDICILVKMLPGQLLRDRGLADLGPTYLDMVDNHTCLRWLTRHPEIRVIVASKSAHTLLAETHPAHQVVFIPQHHCNIERLRRPPGPLRTVGYIGTWHAMELYRERIACSLYKMGLGWRWCTDYQTRHDVVAFYQQVDLQLTWREGMPFVLEQVKNPMKIINAASFGIPTVTQPEVSFVAECAGRFLPASTMDEALEQIDLLRTDPLYYATFADLGPALAEPYHLDHVIPLYRRLADE